MSKEEKGKSMKYHFFDEFKVITKKMPLICIILFEVGATPSNDGDAHVEKDEKDEGESLQLVGDSNEQGSTDGPTIQKMEDVITIDPEAEVLDLNHARIGKIEHLERMAKLERLFMRWNLLKKIENLDTLTGLVELELYDNQITEIENLDNLVNLE